MAKYNTAGRRGKLRIVTDGFFIKPTCSKRAESMLICVNFNMGYRASLHIWARMGSSASLFFRADEMSFPGYRHEQRREAQCASA
ncbi:MAG: hypothetical protein V4484_08880 [Pseudomonadota bacterium]